MVKVFRMNSPFSILLILGFLAVLFFVGLPLLLIAAGSFVLLSTLRKLLPSATTQRPQNKDYNSNVSPVIHNDKIGSYRVIENPNDPDVIEVEKA